MTEMQRKRARRNQIVGAIVWCICFTVALFADSWVEVIF